jgi:hypothetical protein
MTLYSGTDPPPGPANRYGGDHRAACRRSVLFADIAVCLAKPPLGAVNVAVRRGRCNGNATPWGATFIPIWTEMGGDRDVRFGGVVYAQGDS